MRSLMFAVLAVAGWATGAQAEEEPLAVVLKLDCVSAELPARPGVDLRLSCRLPPGTKVQALVDLRAGRETLNPFARGDLWDPFAPARPRYVDPFEGGRFARARTSDDLRNPFGSAKQAPLTPAESANDDPREDPVGAKARGYTDPFEAGRYARPRTSDELHDPFGAAGQPSPVPEDESAD
jgi:hypothetical protein